MTQAESTTNRGTIIILSFLCLGAAGFLFALSQKSADALVVYCAHDAVYAQAILEQFTQDTGIEVSVRFDTEATKSLGLIQQIIAERDQPRCDVFWNNQILGTVQLREAGVLEAWQGESYQRIPDRYKDPEGYWAGFGGRLRVFIVNTNRLPDVDDNRMAQLAAGDLARAAIAKPLYGTTLSHYSVIWDLDGADSLRAWHQDLRSRGVREVQGNSTVKNLVAQGVCDFGWTDTDDYFVAVDEGAPVQMLPVRCSDNSTICIPNSVAIIKGTSRSAQARVLVDYLLSAQTEVALANSRSRQIPLGPVDETLVPAEVRSLRTWARDGYDVTKAAAARNATMQWLETEYLQ